MRAWFSRGAVRTRWSAVGAAVAITAGGGGLLGASAGDTDSTSTFTAIAPCRILDTREASSVGGRTAPLGPGETYSIPTFGTNGNCTLPTGFTALALNVTVAGPTGDSYLTVFPAGATVPTASNLNFVANQAPVPNAVTVAVAPDGRISFYNNGGSVNVIADVVGYYASHSHDDRYYTKAEVDARIDAIPDPTRVLTELYSAATYKIATAGCPAGQAKLVRNRQWGVEAAMPAELACVELPTWTDVTDQTTHPIFWYGAVTSSLPAGVRAQVDTSVALDTPVVGAAYALFNCTPTAAGPLKLVQCGLQLGGLPGTYPYNSKTAIDVLIGLNAESNAVTLSTYTAANP